MRGHQKSLPNLKFLQPQSTALITPSNSSIRQKYQEKRTYRKFQKENSLQIDKNQTPTPIMNNVAKVFRQNFIQKTEPNETSDKQNRMIENQKIISQKPSSFKFLYRPITKQNSELMLTPRIAQNLPENNYVYYVSDLIKAYESKDSYFNRLFQDHLQSSLMAFKQCATSKIIFKPKPLILPKDPKDSRKYTLLLDLDETLVHCSLDVRLPCDKKLNIKLSPSEILQVGLTIRPGLQNMLENLQPHFEIIIFTASHAQYAKKIVEYIDPKKIISYVLSREHCCFTSLGQYIKDLSIIKNRSLSKIILVDNSAYSYYYQIDNGVPIIPFYDNKQDKQLTLLTKYLIGLLDYQDIREYNQKYLKTYLLDKLDSLESVIENYKAQINSKKT
ncbi:unnamed protein product [Paramecium pentaurelia]|uniref:FCP1 homology domain-containing protein n=1 Tax=Paramecium pentaurelia TaxID=43138 RepID=A0A8S1VM51_9CILI|nr:unnamed protein product [Paramecium pentaurelia]